VFPSRCPISAIFVRSDPRFRPAKIALIGQRLGNTRVDGSMRDDASGAESAFESRLTRALVAWVDGVRARARAVLIATGLFTVGCIAFAVTHIGINTSHTALLSEDLPFWQQYMAYAKVFPILDEALLVVVDADSALAARDATELLAARLREMPDRFSSVYVPGGGVFFERHALLYLSVDELEELSDQIAAVQPILKALAEDDSIKRLADLIEKAIEQAEAGEDDFVDLGAVFDSLSVAVRSVLEGRPRPVSWLDLVSTGGLESGDTAANASRRIIVIHPVFDYSALLPGAVPMRAVRDAAAELRLAAHFGARVRITGNVALNTEEMITVAEQSIFAAVGSLVVVVALLAVALRSRRLVVAIVTTLLTGLAWTAAFAGAAVGSLNVVSIAFAVLFIGLGVDFGIHLGMRYAELVRAGASHTDALSETARSVGSSLVLCAVTTSIGFFVFVPTDYRAVAELGLISGTGMLISLFCSLTVLPALLSVGAEAWVARNGAGSAWSGAVWFERALAVASMRHPGRVMFVALIVGVASAAAIPKVRFDHNVVAMRDASTESAQTFDELLADSDTSPWSIDVIAPDLAAADELARRLQELDTVDRAVTLRDYVPADQDDKLEILEDLAFFVPRPVHAGDGASAVEPGDVAEQIEALRGLQKILEGDWLARGDAKRAASAARASREIGRFLAHLETLDRRDDAMESLQVSLIGDLTPQLERLWNALGATEVTVESLPADLTERMVAKDGRARIQVLPSKNLASNAEHARFVDSVRALVPGATGSAVSLLEWARAVVRSFQQALVSAVIAVSVTLWLLWRRLGDMLLVLLPLLLAAAATAALSVAFAIPFNFANVIVLPLLLGIGVDSGVHMVHRFRESSAQIDAAGAAESAGRELLGTSTAQAVLFSALTTIASFGSLALSSHVGFSSLGKLLVIGVVLMLMCNLVVLPALIARRELGVHTPEPEVTRAES